MADRVGQQLGNYRLVRLLGRGGFAEVYLGEHLRLSTQAAIKVLSTHLTQEDEAVFQQEARTIAALEHPHIVRVLDFDVQDGTPFLVMSYAANGTLRTRHPRGTRLPLETIVPYVKQVADALHYAHEEKLIHRDIKPENMLLGKRNEVLLSDFGIATVAQSSRYQGTQEVAGTVAYMAPEQVQGKPRPASDQYALGIVVYEWLAGERPFHGTFTEIATQHVLAPPPPLREKLPDLSPVLEEAVMIALAKDPKERFGSVLAFATALEQAQQPNASLHFAPTQIMRPSTPLLEPTIAVTPEHRPAAEASLPTELPAPPAVQRRSIQTPSFKGTTLLTYRGHQEWVCVVAWSPDGQLIASLDSDGRALLWEASSGTLVTYPDQKGLNALSPSGALTLSFSPKGKYLAFALADQTVQIWNIRTGRKARTYGQHSAAATTLSWSPDSKYLVSGGQEKEIHLWEAATGSAVLTYRAHHRPITALAWSPDGALIGSASKEGAIHLWRPTGDRYLTYSGHPNEVYALAWSPDGRRMASAGEDKTVQIWDTATGHLLVSHPGSNDWISSIAWSPDGRYIASIDPEGIPQIWDSQSGADLFTYRGHAQLVTAIAWSPTTNTIASAGQEKTVHIWSLE